MNARRVAELEFRYLKSRCKTREGDDSRVKLQGGRRGKKVRNDQSDTGERKSVQRKSQPHELTSPQTAVCSRVPDYCAKNSIGLTFAGACAMMLSASVRCARRP